MSCLSPSEIKVDIKSEKVNLALQVKVLDDILPAIAPQDLKLDPFATLEDGIFVIDKNLSYTIPFPSSNQ